MTGPVGVTDSRPLIEWQPVEGATDYRILITEVATFDSGRHIRSAVYDIHSIEQPFYQFTNDHDPGRFKVWVQATTMEGVTQWSPPFLYNVLYTWPRRPPELLSVRPLANDTSQFEIRWAELDDAESYDVSIVGSWRDPVNLQYTTSDTRVSTDFFGVDGATYAIYLRGANPANFRSQWSPAHKYVLSAQPEFGTVRIEPAEKTSLLISEDRSEIQWDVDVAWGNTMFGSERSALQVLTKGRP